MAEIGFFNGSSAMQAFYMVLCNLIVLSRLPVESIKFHKNVYSILSRSKVYLEAVLMSHDCSVTSLYWVKFGDVLQLASSSLDCTVCIWGNVGNTDGAWTI